MSAEIDTKGPSLLRLPSEVMIDLETLSKRKHAVILVIAGVRFYRENINSSLKELSKFYVRIDIDSCTKLGMHVCEDTKEWWDKQSPEVREEAFGKTRVSLKKALKKFSEWFEGSEKIWGNGSGFDCSILAEAYDRCGMKAPWRYYHERDVRTIFDLANVNNWDLPNNLKHHALYDCWRQIYGVQLAYQRLKGKKCEKKIKILK